MESRRVYRICIVFILSCLLFGGMTGCKREKTERKPKVSHEAFQKIKVTDTEGVTSQVSEPVIDYSADDKIADEETFGIRIKTADGTETIMWEEIKHIGITVKNNKPPLSATIELADGKTIDADLAQDSPGGLSGTTDSGAFQISLVRVKSIDVIKR
jgi:hypothetical protein